MLHPMTLLPGTPEVSGMQPLTGKFSIVTGGAGFIGRHLVQLLLDRGHRVRVLDVQAPKDLDERVDYVHGTILDGTLLRSVMEGADHVFHLAANPSLRAVDKQEFYRLNFLGTRAVLEAAGRAGVNRIIHTSTESILKGRQKDKGDQVNETVVRTVEDMPGLYCRSKFLAEQEAMSSARYGLPVIIVNPTLPIGPGDYLITPPTRMLLDYLNGSNPGYLEFDLNL